MTCCDICMNVLYTLYQPIVPPLTLSLLAQPTRYRDGTFLRTTSEYAYSYRKPEEAGALITSRNEKSQTWLPLLAGGARAPERNRGRMRPPDNFQHNHYIYEDVPFEQRSARLWARTNPAHYVFPYQTETQRSYAAVTNADPIDRKYFTKCVNKEYKEAMLKAKTTQVLRGAQLSNKKSYAQ